MAGYTGFEPVISGVTGQRPLQTGPIPLMVVMVAGTGIEPVTLCL